VIGNTLAFFFIARSRGSTESAIACASTGNPQLKPPGGHIHALTSSPALSSFPLLAPDALAASAAKAVREILAEAASANTTRSYHSALRYWAAWFQGRYGTAIALPVSMPAPSWTCSTYQL
jgi:hypothetical protein